MSIQLYLSSKNLSFLLKKPPKAASNNSKKLIEGAVANNKIPILNSFKPTFLGGQGYIEEHCIIVKSTFLSTSIADSNSYQLLIPDDKKTGLFKIEIFSSDTMNKKDSKEKIQKIINNETQILVGTQLISKGFHFPYLNCIVVVDIDLSSQGHDLRGAEKNLQLYHQLSGRAGRTGKPAIVYFQTYENNSKMISELTNENPDIFLDRELEIRKKNKLPPYQRFISLILTGENENKLEKEAFNFKNFIENKIEGKILGPVNAPLFRLKKKFRIRFLIRGPKSMKMQTSLAKIIPKYKFSNGIKLSVDVDPINFN